MSKLHDHYAFPQDPVIETVMRFGAVKRWHTFDTSRPQTLADHSGNVALLVYAISYTTPGAYFPTADAVLYALMHDVPEVFTGDPPAPMKKHLQGFKELETELTPIEFRRQPTPDIKILTKICDVADSLRFIRLYGIGGLREWAIEFLTRQFDDWVGRGIAAWPPEVLSHVVEKAWFYAYETGVEAPQGSQISDGRALAPDLARGQGDNAGGPGCELRYIGFGKITRDRVAGTEGSSPTDEEWKPGLSD